MKVFCKATIFAVKEIDDNLVGDRLEEAISDFETDMRLDIDNMQNDSSSDYIFVSDVGSALKKDLIKEDSYLFNDLLRANAPVIQKPVKKNAKNIQSASR